MSDPAARSKLDALGDILGVDDTEEIERPEEPLGIAKILGDASQTRDPSSGSRPDAVDQPAPAAARPEEPARSEKSPGGPPKPARRRDRTDRSGSASPAKVLKRTSTTLPGELVPRLKAAHARRWGVPAARRVRARAPAPRRGHR